MRRTPKRNVEWREAKQAFQPPAGDSAPTSEHRGVDPAIYEAVVARDQGCVGKRLIGGDCWGRLDPHHVFRAGQGAPDDLDTLALLCRLHHDWVHGHISKSLDLGLLSRSWDGIEGARAAARLRRRNP